MMAWRVNFWPAKKNNARIVVVGWCTLHQQLGDPIGSCQLFPQLLHREETFSEVIFVLSIQVFSSFTGKTRVFASTTWLGRRPRLVKFYETFSKTVKAFWAAGYDTFPKNPSFGEGGPIFLLKFNIKARTTLKYTARRNTENNFSSSAPLPPLWNAIEIPSSEKRRKKLTMWTTKFWKPFRYTHLARLYTFIYKGYRQKQQLISRTESLMGHSIMQKPLLSRQSWQIVN